MKALYDAIVLRYTTDSALKALTLKIYRGFEGDRVRSGAPYAVLEVDDVENLDTFGDDIERHSIRIVYYSGQSRHNRSTDWLEAVVDAFAEADLSNGQMITAEVSDVRRSGPTIDSESKTYQAEASFDVYVQRRVPLPAR